MELWLHTVLMNADVVAQHISEVQAQLSVAVQGRLGAGHVGAERTHPDVAAAFLRVNGDRAGAYDNVARLVGVSHGGGDGQGQQRSGEKSFAHDVLPESISS